MVDFIGCRHCGYKFVERTDVRCSKCREPNTPAPVGRTLVMAAGGVSTVVALIVAVMVLMPSVGGSQPSIAVSPDGGQVRPASLHHIAR